MRLEIIVDGQLAEVPPRREEMIRLLLREPLDLDTMEVGDVQIRFSYDKVNISVRRSRPSVRILRWAEWVRGVVGRSA